MKMLSLKEIDMFDYLKTKANVEEYLSDLNIIKFKYRNVMPPSIASKLFEIKVQTSSVQNSAIESYVLKKDEFEREYLTKLVEIELIVSDLSYLEQRFFKDYFIHGMKINTFEKEFKCGSDKVEHIKKSSIIKFALSLDLAVYK